MNCLPVRFATLSMRSVISMPKSPAVVLEGALHGDELDSAAGASAGRGSAIASAHDFLSFISIYSLCHCLCQRRRGGGGAKPNVDSSQNRFFSPHSTRCLRHSVSRHSYLMK